MSNTPWMHLHRSDKSARSSGLQVLHLDLYEGDKRIERLEAVSGAPSYQVFRTGQASRSGSMEPIPEGRYVVFGTEWAGRPGDWMTSFSQALGPWINVVENDANFWTERSELRFHMDWNQAVAPGTAGCIAFEDRATAQVWLDWRAKHAGAIKLIVDYGLGSVRVPSQVPKLQPVLPVKAFLTEGRTSALVDGQKVAELDLRVKRNANGSLHYWRDGAERKAVSIEILVREQKPA